MQNNTSIHSDLKSYIKTTRDLEDFSSDIDKVLEAIFKNSTETFENASKEISVKAGEKIKDLFLKNKIDPNDKEAIRDFLTNLKKSLSDFKVIKLTIAFEPSQQTVENIYNWVLVALKGEYILDINVDENILGGMIIVFNGRFKDYSVKRSLKDLFEKRRNEILQNIPAK